MSSAKKYQVFISSTYTDLLNERQAAVEAILKAGHIPAGMELFTSTNKSQWTIIQRWIDESDIYMLILGGRYGSIDPESGKSYTHLEYEYAHSINKPLFAVVINDDALRKKTYDERETVNPKSLDDFRQQVLSYLSSFFSDSKDIKLAVHESLGTLIQDNELIGWVRGNQQNEGLASELVRLNEENRKLREENDEFKRNQLRLPKLTVEINDGQPLILKYQEYKNLHYKKRQSIGWSNVDDELKEFLTVEEVEQYNQQLIEITEEKINEFNRLNTLKGIFENGIQPIKFKVSNVGSLKANQVYITIKFPNFIYVEEKNHDKERLGFIEELEKKSLEIIQNPLWNPLQVAQEKLQNKKLEEQNPFKNIYGLTNRILERSAVNVHSIARVDPLRGMTIPKISNIHGDHDYLDGSKRVVIEMGNLLHTLSQNYQDYYIFALERGEGNITVTLHCEEYSNEETIEIPIIVE
ncbi:DUF4062 domain-containing protein [Acinetobacter baumannii]|uniref:DUF4062 domain-containing protein n=7 Tax=Acinetobacter baumannii TaxID=470 RepID=UPI0002AEE05D|nr:DUF4062 domain-containing protein [Acinetobacter baumannii]ELW89730.1 PF13271 domain protein [Acinetobacter baumannii AA-014]MBD0074405.1 DUF4062 domain-containing protein [Acinetobacter baumannii]MBD0093744.1 DUF4062 domain-containing protein [Acinetobacter baumannii]MBD0124981.1 DUF4062 domain-containing protein [Acinetobacter baumannii]MBD0131282.1 DUF4062 domain-containing protein [Acinetobacter baumannii]